MADFKIGKFEKALAKVAPRLALKRVEAQMRMFRYDGARRTRERGTAGFGGTQNPEAMQNQRDRIDMLWESRDLAENHFLAKVILTKLCDYAFGDIRWMSRTGKRRVDIITNDYIKEKAKKVDVQQRMSLRRFTRMLEYSKFRDGDIGILDVFGPAGEPLVQAIECDRIGHPLQITRYDPHYAGGMIINDFGQVEAVRIYQRLDSGLYTAPQDFEAANFSLLQMTNRFDQYRGVTAFHAVLQTLRDLAEIIGFEKMGVKWASSITGVIFKEGGAATNSDIKLDEDVSTGGNPATNKLEVINPTNLKYLDVDEKLQQLVGQRPTDSWANFMDRLVRDICSGCNGLPFGFIYNAMGLNGNVARLESTQMERVCLSEQKDMEDAFLIDWVRRQIATGVEDGDIPDIGMDNQYQGKFLYGAFPTMDVTRESAANLAENRQGMMSAADIYAEKGKDVYEEQEQIADEAANLLALARKKKVPISMIQTLSTSGKSDEVTNSAGAAQDTTGRLVDSIGAQGITQVAAVMTEVAQGTLPEAQAIDLLVVAYGMTPEAARLLIPKFGSAKPVATPPKPGGQGGNSPGANQGGKGQRQAAGPGKKQFEDEDEARQFSLQLAEADDIQAEMAKYDPDSPEYEYLKNKLTILGA